MSKNGAFARGIIVGWFIATVFFVFVPTAHCQTPTPAVIDLSKNPGYARQDDAYQKWMHKQDWMFTRAIDANGHGIAAQAIPPLPGWWRYGNQYLPCNYTPYGQQTTANPGGGWLDPTNGLPFYARYDTAAMQFFPNHAPDGTYEGQGGPNHTDQYLVSGRILPFNPGDNPPPQWWYPAPVVLSVCPLFLSYSHNAGRVCPTDTEAHYTSQTLGNPVWQESWQAIKPQHDADCQNPGPTWTPTQTKTPAQTATPVPPSVTPTPSQGDASFTTRVEAVNRAGLMAGCGNGKFCGYDDVQRQQLAAILVNAFHLQLLPCQGTFTDQPCPTPTPTPHP